VVQPAQVSRFERCDSSRAPELALSSAIQPTCSTYNDAGGFQADVGALLLGYTYIEKHVATTK
jgi:hypothetical protein